MGTQTTTSQKTSEPVANNATAQNSMTRPCPASPGLELVRLQRAIGNRAVASLVRGGKARVDNNLQANTFVTSPFLHRFLAHSSSPRNLGCSPEIVPTINRQPEEEKEPIQTILQREREEEEPVQAILQHEPEEDEPVQATLQRQPEEEEKLQPFPSDTAKGNVGDIPSSIQPKLTLGKPGDIYETEADQVAGRVMTMPDPGTMMQSESKDCTVRRAGTDFHISPIARRSIGGNSEIQESGIDIRRKAAPGVEAIDEATSSRIQESQGKGEPLSPQTAQFMENRFESDFSSVRIHTDSQAASFNKTVHARAFTLGSDIYFNEGQYNPHSHEGNRLIAHELTHTIQQGASPARKAMPSLRTAAVVQGGWFGIDLSLKGLLNKVTGFIPGFSLLTLVLGRNPITEEKVERTPINFVKAILGLIPVVGPILLDNLQKTGALEKAGAWLSAEIDKLGVTWEGVKALLGQAWERLGITLGIEGNLQILKDTFGPIVQRIKTFVGSAAGKIKEIVLESALALAGGAGQQVTAILNKGKAVFDKILDDPIGFVGNFFKAVGQGVQQFASNFLTHFKDAVFGWLFGSFAKAGIHLPKTIDLPSIFGFVAEVLGVTYQAIRARIAKALGPKGEEIVSKVEQAIDFVKDLVTRGPIALWEKVKDMVGDLKTMIMTEVGAWVSKTIIGKAIEKIVSMCNPVGAIIQAAISIYNTVMFFVERWTQIKEFVDAIFNSINDIAFGNIGKAANYIEKVMAKGLTLLISFLARLIGLGGIVDKIRDVIKKFADMIGKALDKVIGFVVSKAKALLGKLMGVIGKSNSEMSPEKMEQINKGLSDIDKEEKKYLKNGKLTREDAENVAKNVKRENPVFKKVSVSDGGKSWNYLYAASPETEVKRDNEKAEKGNEENVPIENGDYIQLNDNKIYMVINKKYELTNSEVGKYAIQVSPPSKLRRAGVKLLFPYIEFLKKWFKIDPPVQYVEFKAFGGPGEGGKVIIDNVHLRNSGSRASGTVPGLSETHPERGHLVANVLGGPGTWNSGNIVAMKLKTNDDMASTIENDVKNDINDNCAVYEYSAKPADNNTPPKKIVVKALRLWPNNQQTSHEQSFNNE